MKIGDKVRLLRGREEGTISSFLSDKLIEIEIEDGFKIPVLRNEVVVIAGDEDKYFDKPNAEVKETMPSKGKSSANEGIFLAFVEINDKQLSLYLVNNSRFDLPFSIAEEGKQGFRGLAAGMLLPGSFKKVTDVLVSNFDLWPAYVVQVLFHENRYFSAKTPLQKKFSFKASSFFRSKRTAPLLNKTSFLFQLDTQSQSYDLETLKEKLFQTPDNTTQNNPATYTKPAKVVDLHIEELTADHSKMKNAEILEMQMNFFEKALDAAIATNMDEITFIHGTGNGILRNAIHKKLGQLPNVQYFIDAQKEKFGYGATLVKIR